MVKVHATSVSELFTTCKYIKIRLTVSGLLTCGTSWENCWFNNSTCVDVSFGTRRLMTPS